MLSRKFRLPREDFFKKKAAITTPFFNIRWNSNNFGFNRYAVVLSSKVEPKSTKRHYLKRQFHENLKDLPALSRDFIIIITSASQNFSSKLIKNQLIQAFSQIKK